MFTLHFGDPDNLSDLTDVVSDFSKPYFVNRETNFSTPFRTNCTFKSSALRSWDDDFRTMMQGVGHGALDFGISTYHGLQTGAAYFGSMDLEMSASSCYHMLQPIMQSQNERLEHIGSHYKRLIGIQEHDSLYELTRSRTRIGLEAASVAGIVYEVSRGVALISRTSNLFIRSAKSINSFRQAEEFINRGTSLAGSRRAPLKYAPYQTIRNEATIINGRPYTGHALDRMQDRGYMPSIIENAIRHGIIRQTKVPGRLVHYDPVNKLNVIVENGKKVITVIPTKD